MWYTGCYISHLLCYTDAIERGYSNIIILEDDCILKIDNNFINQIEKLLNKYNPSFVNLAPLTYKMKYIL